MTGLAILSPDVAAVAVGACKFSLPHESTADIVSNFLHFPFLSGFGAISRYQAGELAAQWIAKDPVARTQFQGWHTAGINIAGSFALGSLAGTPTFSKPSSSPQKFSGLSPRSKLMLGVGFCGSFTTFSTFSVDVVKWMAEGQIQRATGYVLANNIGGVAAAGCGLLLMKKIFG